MLHIFSTVEPLDLLFFLLNQKYYVVYKKINHQQFPSHSFLPNVHPPAHCESASFKNLSRQFNILADNNLKLMHFSSIYVKHRCLFRKHQYVA